MPQMAPMNWSILFTMFIILLILFTMLNYYMYLPLKFQTKNSKNYKILSKNWKW
nr:ATP synthase F0 subunit 8 [Serichlamys sp.]